MTFILQALKKLLTRFATFEMYFVQDVEESLLGIGTIEQWLWKAQKILHYNHVWILEMEFQLVVAYSRLIEDILCQSTAASAKHKLRPMRERVVQMTMHLLEVSKIHKTNII